MQANDIDLLIHLLGESSYEANCTFAGAHGSVAYMDVGEGRELGAVSFATPWNRITIPRRGALPCTPANPHFASSNCGF
jgi:hypothetical protein